MKAQATHSNSNPLSGGQLTFTTPTAAEGPILDPALAHPKITLLKIDVTFSPRNLKDHCLKMRFPHVMKPHDFVWVRPRRHSAFEVDVIAVGDVVGVEAGAQTQPNYWSICNNLEMRLCGSGID